MFDIIIIGGGPAGAILAKEAAKNFSVAMIYEDSKKPCGGLLSDDAQRFFAERTMALPKELLVDPQIFAVDTIDVGQNLWRRYQRSYINIDRKKFDAWLRSFVPENVVKIENHASKIVRMEDRFAVSYNENGEEKTVYGKYLVGADGANSLVRRTFFPNKKIRHYVSVQQSFENAENAPFYACIFDKETTDCCAWIVTKENETIFGGAFAPKDCRENFEKLKTRLKSKGIILGKEKETEGCIVLRPKSSREIILGDGKVFLIGEAAGFISPSSLEGISKAMYSAEAFADALNTEKPLKEYKKNTRKLRFGIFLKTVKCPFMYAPFLRKLVMKSGLTAIDIK